MEGAGVAQADQEKKKRKKSEVVKPKLNIRRDNISQLSVGNLSYNKHTKTGKSPKTVVDRLDEDDIDSSDNNQIPGLQLSQTPLTLKLNLSDLKPIKERIKVKKTSVSESSSILEEEDEGWTKVSKGSGRKENVSPDHDGKTVNSIVKRIEADSRMSSELTMQICCNQNGKT